MARFFKDCSQALFTSPALVLFSDGLDFGLVSPQDCWSRSWSWSRTTPPEHRYNITVPFLLLPKRHGFTFPSMIYKSRKPIKLSHSLLLKHSFALKLSLRPPSGAHNEIKLSHVEIPPLLAVNADIPTHAYYNPLLWLRVAGSLNGET